MKTRIMAILLLVTLAAQVVAVSSDQDSEDEYIVDKEHSMVFKIISKEEMTVMLLYVDPQQAYGLESAEVPGTVRDEDTGKEYTVVQIDGYQFESNTLMTITLPKTIVDIQTQAFSGSEQLTDIKVEEGSEKYCDDEGVLYTSDCKRLLKYPPARAQEEYAVHDNTESIGPYAFESSANLMTVSMKNVHTLEDYAFYSCDNLGSSEDRPQFVFRDGEPTIAHVLTSAMLGCKGLLSFPFEAVEDIGPSQFQNCDSLTVVNLPATLIYVDHSAFYYGGYGDQPKLSQINVQAENPFYSSYDGVLIDDTNHSIITYPAGKEDETFIIPDSVISLQKDSFAGNVYLKVLKYPLSLVFVDEHQVQDCTSLESFEYQITSGLYAIGDSQFYGCESLRNVTLDGVAYIGQNAFGRCTSLTKIVIPSSVLFIGDQAFCGCSSLTEFVASNEKGYYQIDGVLFNRSQTTTRSTAMSLVCYPAQKDRGEDRDVTYAIPAQTAWIEPFAFDGCNIKSLILSKALVAIDDYALINMRYLEVVDMGGSVTRIGNSAFENCNNLTKIIGSQSVTSVGPWQFDMCINLTSLPDMPALKSISEYAFCNTGITEVVLPATVEQIESSAFSGTAGLKYLEIESGSADISPYAFSGIGENSMGEPPAQVTVKCHKSLLQYFIGEIPENVTLVYYEDREFPMENIIGIIVCAILLIIIANSFRRI